MVLTAHTQPVGFAVTKTSVRSILTFLTNTHQHRETNTHTHHKNNNTYAITFLVVQRRESGSLSHHLTEREWTRTTEHAC